MKSIVEHLGNVTAVIGTQWGDEGKGKATDYLGGEYDIVARAAGGANAGHTIVIEGKKHVFHLLPSAVLNPKIKIVLGPGMVIHLPTLLEEISVLESEGIQVVDRLRIARNAHVVLDIHKEIDGQNEEIRSKDGDAIGTTKRGIGPAYVDKAMRTGLRMEALQQDEATRESSLDQILLFKKQYSLKNAKENELANLAKASLKIADCITDTTDWLHAQYAEGKSILIEGAQAMLLDIDHGTYPYVTSSATTAAGALQGLGLAPRQLKSVVGVVKAYCTRVGNGDFPTEELGDTGDRLRKNGGEYGATTGRPRRCGWLSIPDILRARDINGITDICLTKLDVLDGEAIVPIATNIDEDGNVTYIKLEGWQTKTAGITKFEDLPKNAQAYIAYIEKATDTHITLIGTGPDRKDLIVR